MKHIGWCLEQIQIAAFHAPQELKTEDDIKSASQMIDRIQEFAETAEALITNPKLKSYLDQLDKAPIEGVMLQAHEVEALLKDLQYVLHHVDLYLNELRQRLEPGFDKPPTWRSKLQDLVQMIDEKACDDRGMLRKELQIAVHEEEELRRIVKIEAHLEAFLK